MPAPRPGISSDQPKRRDGLIARVVKEAEQIDAKRRAERTRAKLEEWHSEHSDGELQEASGAAAGRKQEERHNQ
jgi:hypothetical protein